MNSALEQWLASCARSPGAFGVGVQPSGQTAATRSFHDNFPPAHLAETLRCLGEFSPILSKHGIFPRWQTWTFEGGYLHTVARPDGALLVFAVQLHSPAAENLATLTEEFLKLKLAET